MNRSRFMLFALAAVSVALISQAAGQSPVDRSVRPKLGPTPQIHLPKIQKSDLPSGLHVWLVEAHKVPLVAFNLVIFAGSDRDPLSQPGVASMTTALMQEGTATRSSLQIAEELDAIGASMMIGAQNDYATAALTCLTKHLDAALAVYGDVLSHPAFPENEFVRVKNERLTSLLQQKDRPVSIANRSFNAILYGPNHPYGNDASGTDASIKALNRGNLVTFYENFIRPNNAVLIVVGDVTMAELKPRLTAAFAGWKKGQVPAEGSFRIPPVGKRTVHLIDKPGAAQSEVRIGYPALARSTKDFFTAELVNLVLGGQFSSRLNSNIREKRGFSYGVRSAFQYSRMPGPFVASGGIQTAKTDSALQQFVYEIDRMHQSGLTADELEFAKNRTKGVFATGFETPSQIARALVNVVVYNLPGDYYVNYLKNVDAVTQADTQRFARKYLDSSKMAIVVVGDLKVIEPGIEAMKFGKVVVGR
jgi:zinc protease